MAREKEQNDLGVLLSAYLDGELSSAQNEKVEKRLATDAQARRQLAELREAIKWVRSTPRARAPKGMAELIQQGLERDLLLGEGQVLGDREGQKHLRLRRFLAAAAMVALMVGIGTMVFMVLSPASRTQPKPTVTADETLVSTPPDMSETTASQAEETYASEVASASVTGMDESLAEEPESIVLADLLLPQLRRGSAHLVVRTADRVATRQRVQAFLADNQLDDVVQRVVSGEEDRYALLCSAETFGQLYRTVSEIPTEQIGAVVDDAGADDATIVPDITEIQTLKLATARTPGDRLAYAKRFRRKNMPPPPAAVMVANMGSEDPVGRVFFESPLDAISKAPTPNSLADLLVMCEPELTNRRPWGADVEQANAPLEPEDTRQRLPPPDPHAQLRSGSISPVLERESPPSAASCGIHLTCTRQCESQSRIVTEQSLRKGNCLC